MIKGQCPSCGGNCGWTKAKGCQYRNAPPTAEEKLSWLLNELRERQDYATDTGANAEMRLLCEFEERFRHG